MFKKVLEYAGEYRKMTYMALLAMLVGVFMSIVPFFFIYQIVSPLLTHQTLTVSFLISRVVYIAVSMILYAIFYVYGLTLSHRSAYNTLKNLRISLQSKMEKLPLGTIQGMGTGSIKKIFLDDIDSIELLLAHTLPEGIANLSIPIMVYVFMFLIDWKLALLSLASLPVGLLAMMMMYKIGMKEMANYYSAAQKMNNTIIEYINGMEVVKVFNRDGKSYQKYEKDIRNYRDFTLAWYKACWTWMALYSSILPCVCLFSLPIGAYLVLKGYSLLSHFVLILCLSFAIGTPLLKSLSFISTMPQINYKMQALEKMLSGEPLQQGQESFKGSHYDIDFNHVHFAYQDDEVLHDISLHIPSGQMVALVGESGSGKSTLGKLLVHFYDVSKGSIKIGHQDLRDISLESLNQQIAYVSQEQYLFNISILENIRIGKPTATDQEVIEAASKAQCLEFLNRFEKGIYTLAGDSGKQLSGGERQRISLARAILKDAPIIVLDEATAFMDPENEEKMNQAIAHVIADKTVIVIAHRLPSIIDADQIIVMSKGHIIGKGTHEQLLASHSEYQKLWKAAQESLVWKVSTEKRGDLS